MTTTIRIISRSIIVRALKDMDPFEMNKVYISYIDLLEPTKRRQEHLLKNYYFSCQVSKLCHHEPSLRCTMTCLLMYIG